VAIVPGELDRLEQWTQTPAISITKLVPEQVQPVVLLHVKPVLHTQDALVVAVEEALTLVIVVQCVQTPL